MNSSAGTRIFRNKETIRYIIAGMGTTALNIGVFQVLLLLDVDYKAANAAAFVASKVFAFWVNRLFVFHVKSGGFFDLVAQMGRFIAARGLSALFDFAALFIAVTLFGFDARISKYSITLLVMIMNYLLAKKMVYVKTRKET